MWHHPGRHACGAHGRREGDYRANDDYAARARQAEADLDAVASARTPLGTVESEVKSDYQGQIDKQTDLAAADMTVTKVTCIEAGAGAKCFADLTTNGAGGLDPTDRVGIKITYGKSGDYIWESY